MRVFRATPRSEDSVYFAGMMLLEEVWSAAAEARAAACEPELSLLKVRRRLRPAWHGRRRASAPPHSTAQHRTA